MKIENIIAREVFDSRGIPTVECEIHLDDGMVVTSSVPSGISRGIHEAFEMRDGGERLMGLGVEKAAAIIEEKIAPLFIGKEPDLINFDVDMIEKDGTKDKSHLGANAMLAVSMGMCRAQAYIESISLYELIAHLCNFETVTLPMPMMNIIGGGMHVNNRRAIQEILLVPTRTQTCWDALEMAAQVFYTLKEILRVRGQIIATGYEGEFVPSFADEKQAFDLVMEAIEKAGMSSSMMISLDVAASHFYNMETGLYYWQGQQVSADILIQWYKELIDTYPIYSIEDGLSEVDWNNWKIMKVELGNRVRLIGDDLFVTNAERIWTGIENNVATTCLIKPNQIGTITEVLQAVTLCKENEWDIIVSHRSGETNDTFIADLAVGVSASHLKAGGLSHGERVAKYNRLIQIEDELLSGQMFE